MNNIRILPKGSDTLEALVGHEEFNTQRQEQDELMFVNGALFFVKTESLLSKQRFHVMPCAPVEMDYYSSLDINQWKI